MDLIDEEDDLTSGIHHFVDHALESLLKLALILGAGNQRTHIERINEFLLQVFGHIASYDTVRQPLGDGGLTYTRFAYQDRVVFGSAA